MGTVPEFESFPKMARLTREIVVTEKIDGTNAQVMVTEDGQVLAGSRNRWIRPGDDNQGFAAWVEDNKDELLKLGPGRHFGEWWGRGIQRGYDLPEKRFSLFNVTRWSGNLARPACCHVVPVLGRGLLSDPVVTKALENLRLSGSAAAPGFMNPEGIIVFHTAAGLGFKKTLEGDESPKSLTTERLAA